MLSDLCLHDTFSNYLYYFQAKTKEFWFASKSFQLWRNGCIFEFVRESLAIQWVEFVGFTHLLLKDTIIQLDWAFGTALCSGFGNFWPDHSKSQWAPLSVWVEFVSWLWVFLSWGKNWLSLQAVMWKLKFRYFMSHKKYFFPLLSCIDYFYYPHWT